MAWLEKRSDTYHVNFFHSGRHFSRSLKTTSQDKAEKARARLEENLADIERGRLAVPDGANLVTFLLSDGKLHTRVSFQRELTLGDLFDRYLREIPHGAKEQNTAYTERIHVKHLLRLIGADVPVRQISTERLQAYITARSAEKGRYSGETSSGRRTARSSALASV